MMSVPNLDSLYECGSVLSAVKSADFEKVNSILSVARHIHLKAIFDKNFVMKPYALKICMILPSILCKQSNEIKKCDGTIYWTGV